MVDLELDPEHFEAAYRYAIQIYRQRSQAATEESYTLMTLHAHQTKYTLPKEFINILLKSRS